MDHFNYKGGEREGDKEEKGEGNVLNIHTYLVQTAKLQDSILINIQGILIISLY